MKLYWVSGACSPDWNGWLHCGVARSNGKVAGIGGSVGKYFGYVCWRSGV